MPWLRSVLREVWGLFVDDGSFAAGIVVWLAVVLLVGRSVGKGTPWGGVALFGGLALLLMESVLRFARRGHR